MTEDIRRWANADARAYRHISSATTSFNLAQMLEKETQETREKAEANPNHYEGSITPFERFEGFAKKIAAVPKEEVDELRAKREQEKKGS